MQAPLSPVKTFRTSVKDLKAVSALAWPKRQCSRPFVRAGHNHRPSTTASKLCHKHVLQARGASLKCRGLGGGVQLEGLAPEPGNLFVFGLGYTALGLATLLKRKGWKVAGTCRGADKQRELQKQGFQMFIFDIDHMTLGLGKAGVAALRGATHVLVTISPSQPQEFCPVMWMLGREFKQVAESVRWIGYLSSTSVYGNWDGEWVTEECEARAEAGNGLARRRAEMAWTRFALATDLPVHIFRLGGIYGPGRSALEAALQAGNSKRSGKKFTSRCHVYDICQVLMASMGNPQPGATYNISDDDPASRETVLDYVQQHFLRGGEERQIAHAAEPGLTRREGCISGAVAEKRVSNAKIKEELGVQLAFPSFREGLKAIHDGNMVPFK